MQRGVTWITQRRRQAGALAVVSGLALAIGPTGSPASAVTTSSVIVRAHDGELADATTLFEQLGGHVDSRVDLINGLIGTLPSDRLDDLALHDEIAGVSPNYTVTMASSGYDPNADPSSAVNTAKVINSRGAWNKGYTGKGIGVAVIDTGVSLVPGLDAPGKVIYGPDFTPEGADPATANIDGYGHGTFIAGLIAANDSGQPAKSLASNSTNYLGIAPDARIISLKVGDSHGDTVVGSVIMALDWVVQHARDADKNIKVVNLSFSTNSTQDYTLDPLAFAAERAWLKGITVVTSAGNSGSTTGRMTMPALDPFVIAVGADHTMGTIGTGDDEIPVFSSRGDGIRNPDLVAPGVSLQGLKVPGSYADTNFGASAAVGDRFFRGSGTSQSAAVVSGAAALLLSQRPTLRPDQVKSLLVNNADKLPNADTQAQGKGLLNVDKAMKASTPLLALQTFWRSTGLGSLLQSGGDWVRSSWSGSTWSGSTWSGSTWSGSTWSGSTWSGSTWSGSTWSGSTWSGSTWSGSTWSTGSWG